MHSFTMNLAAEATRYPGRLTNSADRSIPPPDETLKAIARRCLEHMLGHPLTYEDSVVLPGINVPTLLPARQECSASGHRSADLVHVTFTTSEQ